LLDTLGLILLLNVLHMSLRLWLDTVLLGAAAAAGTVTVAVAASGVVHSLCCFLKHWLLLLPRSQLGLAAAVKLSLYGQESSPIAHPLSLSLLRLLLAPESVAGLLLGLAASSAAVAAALHRTIDPLTLLRHSDIELPVFT
jgi:hypothetical protein